MKKYYDWKVIKKRLQGTSKKDLKKKIFKKSLKNMIKKGKKSPFQKKACQKKS